MPKPVVTASPPPVAAAVGLQTVAGIEERAGEKEQCAALERLPTGEGGAAAVLHKAEHAGEGLIHKAEELACEVREHLPALPVPHVEHAEPTPAEREADALLAEAMSAAPGVPPPSTSLVEELAGAAARAAAEVREKPLTMAPPLEERAAAEERSALRPLEAAAEYARSVPARGRVREFRAAPGELHPVQLGHFLKCAVLSSLLFLPPCYCSLTLPPSALLSRRETEHKAVDAARRAAHSVADAARGAAHHVEDAISWRPGTGRAAAPAPAAVDTDSGLVRLADDLKVAAAARAPAPRSVSEESAEEHLSRAKLATGGEQLAPDDFRDAARAAGEHARALAAEGKLAAAKAVREGVRELERVEPGAAGELPS